MLLYKIRNWVNDVGAAVAVGLGVAVGCGVGGTAVAVGEAVGMAEGSAVDSTVGSGDGAGCSVGGSWETAVVAVGAAVVAIWAVGARVGKMACGSEAQLLNPPAINTSHPINSRENSCRLIMLCSRS